MAEWNCYTFSLTAGGNDCRLELHSSVPFPQSKSQINGRHTLNNFQPLSTRERAVHVNDVCGKKKRQLGETKQNKTKQNTKDEEKLA